jgi:hypothetical protein
MCGRGNGFKGNRKVSKKWEDIQGSGGDCEEGLENGKGK